MLCFINFDPIKKIMKNLNEIGLFNVRGHFSVSVPHFIFYFPFCHRGRLQMKRMNKGKQKRFRRVAAPRRLRRRMKPRYPLDHVWNCNDLGLRSPEMARGL